ncbi:hypothetical protein BT69DRAFT_40689 [Atractiella rhizophila]|nr:hypothetical protein BT69DRAFT_40689 [Atractiella rhizophila]
MIERSFLVQKGTKQRLLPDQSVILSRCQDRPQITYFSLFGVTGSIYVCVALLVFLFPHLFCSTYHVTFIPYPR